MAVEKDPYAVESGLLTNYEGLIVDAHFGSDPAYNPDTRILFLKMQTDAPEKPEHEERYNLPPGWETWDGGATVENRERGGLARFNARSQIGKLLTRMQEQVPEAIEVMRSKGAPWEAKSWVGLKFFWEEVAEPYSFRDRQTGEQRTGSTSKNYPSKFLGLGDVQEQLPRIAKSEQTGLLSDTDRTIIKLLAKTNDHPTWVERVMEYDGGRFCSMAELIAQLSDDSPTGFYGGLRAEE